MLLCCYGHRLGRIINMCMCEPAFGRKPLFILPTCSECATIRAHLCACPHWNQSLLTLVFVEMPQWLSRTPATVRDMVKTPLVLERWDQFSVLTCLFFFFFALLLTETMYSYICHLLEEALLKSEWLSKRNQMFSLVLCGLSVYNRLFFPSREVRSEGARFWPSFFPFVILILGMLWQSLFPAPLRRNCGHIWIQTVVKVFYAFAVIIDIWLQLIQLFWWVCRHVIVSALASGQYTQISFASDQLIIWLKIYQNVKPFSQQRRIKFSYFQDRNDTYF